MAVKDYRQLETWQRAMDLAEAVYAATRNYPKEETYGLMVQTRRSARGSLYELETQLLLAVRFQYVDQGSAEPLLSQAATVGRLLNGLIRSVAPDADRS